MADFSVFDSVSTGTFLVVENSEGRELSRQVSTTIGDKPVKIQVLSLEELAKTTLDVSSFDALAVSMNGSSTESLSHGGQLPLLLKSIKPGAPAVFVAPSSIVDTFAAELTLSGFVEVSKVASGASDVGVLQCKRPAWELGAKASLKRRVAPAAQQAPAAKISTWTVATAMADAELIDEDSLLADDIVPVKKEKESCAPKRRACANCTCGRKEEEEKAVSEVSVTATDDFSTKTSSCGNCYKGDAFRCASCPFLGKPAFRPGEAGTVMLDTSASDL